MKIRSFLVAIPLALCLDAVAAAEGPVRRLDSIFVSPPHSARPQVWWHWMDGNVSKEGIRKDLEWMERSGIGGFHQFDAGGVNMPRAIEDRLPYLSEGWKDAFRFALTLADSLGLEATIASAPGWSSTGGPWVSPEDAVKKLEWRSVDVEGGKVSVRMPDLYRTVGPYQDFFQDNDRIKVGPYGKDLYVIAIRRPKADLSMEEMGAESTVSDSVITVKFKKKRTIKALTLKSMAMGGRLGTGEPDFTAVLECSDDGKAWCHVCRVLPARIPYMTEDIVPTTARRFRVRGRKLESLTLFTVRKVNHSEELGGFSNAFDFNRFHTPGKGSPAWREDAVKEGCTIDLTEKMQPDGTLDCTLPRGRWRIYRFGWSITGKVNHPASPEATGLEVDKLDKDAWMRYFRHYLDLYKEAAGGMLGKEGITHLLTDSYEAGSFTWTSTLPREFKARRGYDLLPWLPVLAGEIVGSAERSEGFLWDWRKTLGELFCENYGRLDAIVEEYGLSGRYCETHEGGRAYVGDGMDPKIGATIPMAAIWMEDTPTGSSIPSAIADIRESASAAHLYGQKIVAAESFTVNGDEGRAYTYSPGKMKFVADVALAAGLNRFVIHESASQPNDGYLPGLQLFRYGQWFHRNETWAEYARGFMDYLARSGAMMQQGRQVADILLYYGEDSNITALYGGGSFDLLPQVPTGYEYDFANPTVLLSGLRIAGTAFPELESVSGSRYKVLWLDKNCETMSMDVLGKVREFAQAGVRICGPAPARCAGLMADEAAFKAMVDDIWHSGRDNVFPTLEDALEGISPDCEASVDGIPLGPEGFRYVHRSLPDGTHAYWIRNFSGTEGMVTFSFREGGSLAALFNPEDGSIGSIDAVRTRGRTTLSLPMLPDDAYFVVLPGNRHGLPGDCPRANPAGRLASSYITVRTVDTPWEVHFEQKGGQVADERLDSLHSWTECGNPVVKYFSGTAVYKTLFEIGDDALADSREVMLDLGSVKDIAEVFVNGKQAGILWKAPFRTGDIKRMLHPGTNALEIKVTNVWRNRMIGDVQPGEARPVTAIRRFYKASDPLLPSGLLGPVGFVSPIADPPSRKD